MEMIHPQETGDRPSRPSSQREALTQAFTPFRPVYHSGFLAGRLRLLGQATDAVNTEGQHLVLFGDHGTGKTSLARVVAFQAQEIDSLQGRRSIFVSCSSEDNFSSIWQKVFREVQVAQRQIGFVQDAAASIIGRFDLPDAEIKHPNDVRLYVSSLPNPPVIFIDEFDRVTDADACWLLADTIKLLADTNTDATVVVVGVADSLADLISGPESIARNIAPVRVSPMPVPELAEIIQKGFRFAHLQYESGVDVRIAQLSQGHPHYTHLLGLWAGRSAIDAGCTSVSLSHLNTAVGLALGNASDAVEQEHEGSRLNTRGHPL